MSYSDREKAIGPRYYRKQDSRSKLAKFDVYDYRIRSVEESEISAVVCLQYWFLHCFLNGMFTTSRIIGYTQFMVYMILRVIIAGSLCGRMFGNDPDNINCTFNPVRTSYLNSTINSSNDPLSSDSRMDCLLREAYHGISPIAFWAVGLLTVFLPWLVLLPWTPFQEDQEYVACWAGHVKWPCLTIYIVRFLRSCLRLLLEFLCLLSVPMWYPNGITKFFDCQDGLVSCQINDYGEKTYFLWMYTTINAVSCCLTITEIFDICRNKSEYECDAVTFSSGSKLSSARSSASNVLSSHHAGKADPNGVTCQNTCTNPGLSLLNNDEVFKPDPQPRFGTTRASEAPFSTNGKFKGRTLKPSEDEIIQVASSVEFSSRDDKSPGHCRHQVCTSAPRNRPISLQSRDISNSSEAVQDHVIESLDLNDSAQLTEMLIVHSQPNGDSIHVEKADTMTSSNT